MLALFPPPVLKERRRRGLARRLVAVRRRPVLILAKGLGPVVATRGVVLTRAPRSPPLPSARKADRHWVALGSD